MKFYLKRTASVNVGVEWIGDSFSTKAEAKAYARNRIFDRGFDDTVWRPFKRYEDGDEHYYDVWLYDAETDRELCCLYSSDGANT